MRSETRSSYPGVWPRQPEQHPYAATLSSSASSSTSSVFSDDGSLASSISSISSISKYESEQQAAAAPTNPASLAPYQTLNRVGTFPQYESSACRRNVHETLPSLRREAVALVEQRQHPRRSSTTVNQRPPPQLVRQGDRKVNFVDCLVDSATQMVEVIWQLSEPKSTCENNSGRGVLPLRIFIQETLRRSRTSYSTLQVALYYLILIKPHLPKHDFTMAQPEDASLRALQCGRRMFLAALILASKYLQDRNYSARAWSKISGLKVCEINTNEMAFLEAVNWKLHIVDSIWEKWQDVMLRHTPKNPPPSSGACLPNTWKNVIPNLTPELDIVHLAPVVEPTLPRRHMGLRHTSPSSIQSYGSKESTPTPTSYEAPRFLEPKPDLLPPTPGLARLGPLTTPALTPRSYTSNTPAASAMVFGMRRPSMTVAMQQAQCSSLARTCTDQYTPSVRNGLEAYHFPSRRASLTPSLSSSPESMVSDNSRSSRASSISSVSSTGLAPNLSQVKLARLATCRNVPLRLVKETREPSTELVSSPEMEHFSIQDANSTPVKACSSMRTASVASRKRGRSSVDLQRNIRQELLRKGSAFYDQPTVLADRSVAQPCNTLEPYLSPPDEEMKGLQSPKHIAPDSPRVPILRDFGKKRTCYAPVLISPPPEGPGMWEGILA